MSKKKKNRNRDNSIEYKEKDHSKYYLFIIKAGIIACLFLPLLIVHNHMFAMQVGKVLVFRTIIEIIVFFYILLIIKKPEYRPKWGLFEISITLFIAVYFFTSFTGANFLRSFWGTAERMGGFFTLLHFWAYFVILISVFKTKRDWKLLFGVSAFVALLSSFYGFGQSVFFWRTILPWIELKDIGIYNEIIKSVTVENFVIINDYRPFGTIGNAGLFTAYILYNLFFGLYLLLRKTEIVRARVLQSRELIDESLRDDQLKESYPRSELLSVSMKIIMKIFYCVTAAFIIIVLIIAGSRSSFLAVISGLFVLALVFLLASKRKIIKVFSIVSIIVLILGSGYVFQNKEQGWVKDNYILARIANISLEGDETRTMTWESSWVGSMDHPILGVGPENYNIVFNKYFNPLHFGGYGYVTWYDKAHNIFLDILTTMGAVGLVSYLGIFGIIYWFLVKNRHRARENLPAFALIASLPVAYFVQNMFWFDDFSSYLMLFLFFAFVSNFFNEELKFEYNVEKGRKIIGFIRKKIGLENDSNSREQIYLFHTESKRKYFIAISGIVLVLMIYYTNVKAWRFHDLTTITVSAFSVRADDSFDWYREAMKNSTYLGRQELFKRFGNFVNTKYAFTGNENAKEIELFRSDMNFAIDEMKKAIDENRHDVQFYSLLGAIYNKYYSNFKSVDRLEENLEKVERADITKWKMRKKNEKHAHLFFVLGEAEKTLQKAVELSPERETVYYEFGQTMVFKKDYKKAIELFKKGVELNPPVPVSHWYLGMAYLNAGKYDDAKIEIEEAIRLGYGYNTVKDILSIVPIYIELKDYVKLEQLYAKVSDLDPNNPDIYVSLALVYKELGDVVSAKKMAEKAMYINEIYRAEGEKFIRELESGM